MDKLKTMYVAQSRLQKTLKTRFDQKFINVMTLGLISEACEALRETRWKPWKIKQGYDEKKFREELIDCQHFLFNLMLAAGMSYKDIYEGYMAKNQVNHERKKEGY